MEDEHSSSSHSQWTRRDDQQTGCLLSRHRRCKHCRHREPHVQRNVAAVMLSIRARLPMRKASISSGSTCTSQALAKPEDSKDQIKFSAAEALGGVGGLVFGAYDNRFANDLGNQQEEESGERYEGAGTCAASPFF